MGGVTLHHVNCDQLPLTQWVQGFSRNILEETDGGWKDIMLSYLADLMEEATDFPGRGRMWQMPYECARWNDNGQWEDGDEIDRSCRGYAQMHESQNRQN